MNSDFPCLPLGSLCEYLNRGTAPSYTEQGGISVLNQRCIREGRIDLSQARRTDNTKKIVPPERLLRSFDIVVNSTGVGTLGRAAQLLNVSEKMTVDSHITIVRPNFNLVDPLYLGFVVREAQEKISNLAEGSTGQTELNRNKLAQIPIPTPPQPEQKAIAHILGTLDDKIELNRKMNETLEAMAQAIFKSWFVDFDPVRAKASGESVESICKRLHLTPEILDLFPSQLVDSELGEIPEGWEVASIKVAANVIYGAPFSSSKFTSKKMGFPLIRIRDLINQSPKIYTEEIHPKGYMVKGGDIVVGMDGEFKAYIWGGEKGWLNQRTCVFEPKDHFSSPFVFYSIKPCLARVEETETATTVIHIGKNDIDAFRIVIPEANILKIFNLLVYPLFVKLVSKKQESRILASIRDALLPKLLSGEIRVKDMDFSASKSLNV